MLLGICKGNKKCRSPGKISWKCLPFLLPLTTLLAVLPRIQMLDEDKIKFFEIFSDEEMNQHCNLRVYLGGGSLRV